MHHDELDHVIRQELQVANIKFLGGAPAPVPPVLLIPCASRRVPCRVTSKTLVFWCDQFYSQIHGMRV